MDVLESLAADFRAHGGVPVERVRVRDVTGGNTVSITTDGGNVYARRVVLEFEHVRLTGKGVVFTQPPTDIGTAAVAVCDDTCGNLIQPFEMKPDEN